MGLFKMITDVIASAVGKNLTPPRVGQEYHQKERDPDDMISYVRVISVQVDKDSVRYLKFYKDPSIRSQKDTATIVEFNYFFREGR
jgi:hypothetical protein